VNALAVARKQIDVATNNTSMVGDPDRDPKAGRLWQSKPDMAAQIRVIWKSPLIPHEPLVYRQDLPEDTKTALRDFFYNYGATPEEKTVLAGINQGIGQFKPADNTMLEPVREIERFNDELKNK
jgi:phosphonate transport system substrate-binding protein